MSKKIEVTDFNNAANKIKEMKIKWGLNANSVPMKNQLDRVEAKDVNHLIDHLIEGKNKSGWGGNVTNKVDVNLKIKEIFSSLGTDSDSIKTHCACNCNHCSCNCNYCRCNCDRCKSCSSSCDSGCDSHRNN